MFKKSLAMVVISVAALTATAPAQARSSYSIDHIYTQCGLGGILFGNVSNVLAVVVNVSTTLGLPAILSATVAPEICGGRLTARAVFIKENFPSIEQDLSSGRGEHLAALNSLMACPTASSRLRNEYARYTLTPNYKEANTSANSEELFRIVNDNLEASNCSVA